MQGSNIHIISRSWKSGSAWFLPGKTWSVNYKLNWEVAVWGCADTSDFEIWGANKFLRKVLLTKPKLHENIPICSWEVNNFHLGVNIPIPYLYRNNTHYVKSVRIRSYSDPHFSSIFPHSDWIREYVGKYADQNNLTLFTQWQEIIWLKSFTKSILWLLFYHTAQKMTFSIKGTLMQIWKSAYIFFFVWK